MLESDVQEIIDCLPKDRTLFYYYKDRYGTHYDKSTKKKGDTKPSYEAREDALKALYGVK